MTTRLPRFSRQQGMSFYGVLFVLIVIGFCATVAVKIGPVYMDNKVVVRALEDIKNTYAGADVQELTDTAIKGKVSNYFQVNMVDPEIEKNVKVTRVKDKVILSIDYEIRKNFMGNLDVVIVFNNEVELGH